MRHCSWFDWNRNADSVTLSFNMGFVGVHEYLAAGAGSIVLDMLLKFGVLKYNKWETWELQANAKSCWLYSFGNRKLNKNCLAFWSTLSHHPWTFEESIIKAEIFLDSFCNIMFLPGDWYTDMNMLQSIYRMFWVEILNPMKTFLGWKRILRDVWGCYFQSAWLVQHIHNFMSMYLLCCCDKTNCEYLLTDAEWQYCKRQL